MKKPAALISLLLACALLLAACSGGGASSVASGSASVPSSSSEAAPRPTLLNPDNPVTITLWHYYVGENQIALESAVNDFNQTAGMEKGVIVDPVAVGSIADLEKNVTESALGVINSAPMPDLFSSYPDKALEIDGLGMLADLNEYFTPAEQELYIADFLADGMFSEGRLLLIPIVKSTELLYVNDTAWAAFSAGQGVSSSQLATWEGVYETARAFYAYTDGETPDTPWNGKALMGFDSVANYVIVACRQLGVEVIRADGSGEGAVVLDDAVMRRVFDVYFQGISLGYFGAVSRFRSDDIKSGDLIAYVGSSSGASYFPTEIADGNTMAPIDFLPLPYPVFEGGEAFAIQQGAGMCVAKNENPAHEEAAAEFLKWFTAVQQNIGFAMTTGYMPVQSAAYTSTEFDTALAALRGGTAAQQVVAGVYSIALEQILEAETYAAQPFPGSYDARTLLQSSLIEAAEAGRAEAAALQAQGLDEEQVLAGLDVDAKFAAWMDTIRDELDFMGIAHTAS